MNFIKKTLQLTSARLKTKEIEIVDNIEEFKLITHENELIQAIINILNNSIDAFENRDSVKKHIIFLKLEKSKKIHILI